MGGRLKRILKHGGSSYAQMFLLALCCGAYLAANLGRVSYGVTLADIVKNEALDNKLAGLIGTGFFICYGAGQILSGFWADRISPRWTMLTGLLISGLSNCAMAFVPVQGMLWVWCVNGFAQSMLWTPIVRIIAEYYSPVQRVKAMMWLSLPYPLAMLVAYGAGAALMRFINWQAVFIGSALVLAAAAIIWFISYPRLVIKISVKAESEKGGGEGLKGKPLAVPYMTAALILMAVVMIFQGVLRDGVTTWVPSYLSSLFNADTSLAVLSTVVLPVVNLAGPVLAKKMYKKQGNEILIGAIFFIIAIIGSSVLAFASGAGYWLSIACLALITSSTTGINMMFVSIAPMHFSNWNKVAVVSGGLNAMVYVGSSISSFGLGAIADYFGWQAMGVCLLIISVAGVLLCLAAIKPWKKFLYTNKLCDE